jgi:hypothetical protein
MIDGASRVDGGRHTAERRAQAITATGARDAGPATERRPAGETGTQI